MSYGIYEVYNKIYACKLYFTLVPKVYVTGY